MRKHLHEDVKLLAEILVLGTAATVPIAKSLSKFRRHLTDGNEVTDTTKCHSEGH